MMKNKLPKITTEISTTASVGDLKAIKSWMKDTKPAIEEYVKEMLDKVRDELDCNWWNVYEISATYFNCYEMPTLMIVGRILEYKTAKNAFVEVFVDRDPGCITHFFRES